MKERAILLHPRGLVGILTEPSPSLAERKLPGFVLLNSGMVHRVGASRIHVQLSRALARAGFFSLRFDFSGIGDSPAQGEPEPVMGRFVREARQAMDFLCQRVVLSRFVLGGLCSGADAAYYTALADPRVVGLWQIDAFTYRTLGHYWRFLWPSRWAPRKLIAKTCERVVRHWKRMSFPPPEYLRRFPPRSEVRGGLEALSGRDVKMFYLFTGEIRQYNYCSQHFDAFPGVDLRSIARVYYRPGCAHTITGLEDQRWLAAQVVDWAVSCFYQTTSTNEHCGS